MSGSKEPAVLVIAHGSPEGKWVERIEETVRQARLKWPVRIAFLEGQEDRSIPWAVRCLELAGIRTIIVVPLFITMGSTHLRDIQTMLGVASNPGVKTGIRSFRLEARILWCPPLEDDPVVLRILEERLRELSKEPSREMLLVVGHGSNVPGFRERWEKLLGNIALRLKETFGFPGASYATLHPDTITRRAAALSRKKRLLVVPFFLSEGYLTRTAIPRRLGGLSCVYGGKTLLPHRLIPSWIEQTAHRAFG